VAPDGPLPMMPTVLIDAFINENRFYGLASNLELFDLFIRISQYQSSISSPWSGEAARRQV